ncbi:EamA family transporter RarD [Methylobacterium pseudosasicola]|uniref:Chloramphenicol-sensitive protein RarD n=1 Tax=Methylobacterium pseudosasicola TaxID=582667 RepID=A0A1I4NBC5_9HYPH|nr:EamA family transporter RarD [Methylobacterium pseudosasicola]SFM12834.1 chloramphenicol-sensitive protein RarD [Methylobacterium pseudosasicola]
MGLVYALAAYLSWGLLVPVHFRMLGAFSPNHILAERIVWSSLFAGGLALALAARKRLNLPLPLRRRHALLAVSAAMIGVNWLLYLYAIDRGHLLDASLGYYINPLVSVAFGRIVLGERLRPLQAVAVGIAASGVAVAVLWAGELPALSLSLAVSFALYGLVRKIVGVDALVGFLAETLLLLPLAILWLVLSPEPFLPAESKSLALLMLTGVTTALPLIWFAAAAVRLRLTTLGLLQYVAPTCLLGLSVLAYGEHVEPPRAAMFALIWVALALYSVDALRGRRPAEPVVEVRSDPDPMRV